MALVLGGPECVRALCWKAAAPVLGGPESVRVCVSQQQQHRRSANRWAAQRLRMLSWRTTLLLWPIAVHASRQMYEREGFFILRGLLTHAEVAMLRANVLSHLSQHDALHRKSMGGNKQGGWYIADFPAFPTLKHVLPLLAAKQKLSDALADVLGGPYRVLSRNELYIDRWNTWHFDGQHAAYGLYGAQLIPTLTEREPHAPWTLCGNRSSLMAPPEEQPCHAAAVAWRTLPNGEAQRIATLALYLEDHGAQDNVQALTVKPRTHTSRSSLRTLMQAIATQARRSALGLADVADDSVVLHPQLGDAVIFDARLLHRGQERRFASIDENVDVNVRNLSAVAPHRIALSVTYARPNAFAEAFERGFHLRNRVTNKQVCHGRGDVLKCAGRVAAAELKKRPVNIHAKPADDKQHALAPLQHDRRRQLVFTSAAASPGTTSLVQYVALNTGSHMPRLAIGTGTHTAAVSEASASGRALNATSQRMIAAASALATLRAALALGYTHVETSEVYPGFDELHRVLCMAPRASYFLTAKVDPTKGSVRQAACAANGTGCTAMVRDAGQDLVKRLGMTHVDLLLLHRPPKLDSAPRQRRSLRAAATTNAAHAVQCTRARAQWRGMEALQSKGVALAIGVSNYCARLLQCVLGSARVRPAVWQQLHHVGMGADPHGYATWARRLGIVYMAYSVLGGVEGDLAQITSHSTLRTIAARHGTSAAEVALRWVAQLGMPFIILSRSEAHLKANLRIFDPASTELLTAADMETISALREPAGRPSHWGSCRDESAKIPE